MKLKIYVESDVMVMDDRSGLDDDHSTEKPAAVSLRQDIGHASRQGHADSERFVYLRGSRVRRQERIARLSVSGREKARRLGLGLSRNSKARLALAAHEISGLSPIDCCQRERSSEHGGIRALPLSAGAAGRKDKKRGENGSHAVNRTTDRVLM